MTRSSDTDPTPDEPTRGGGGFKRAAKLAWGSLGCLVLLLLASCALIWVLALFIDDPAVFIALVALCVAVGAYQNSKRR